MTVYTKGSKPKNADYAHGGGVFTSRSQFMKAPDIFRAKVGTERVDYDKTGKQGEWGKASGDDKKMKAIKPRG